MADSVMAEMDALFEVVGGAASGGIIVREGCTQKSVEQAERLAVGSVIRAMKTESGRVQFELVSGKGPAQGWVSAFASGRALLTSLAEKDDDLASTATPPSENEDAVQWYAKRLAEARSGNAQDILGTQCAVAQCQRQDSIIPALAEFQKDDVLSTELARTLWRKSTRAVNGSLVCQHCRLPMGEVGYAMRKDNGDHLMHAECIGQVVLQERQKDEVARRSTELELKVERRSAYDIGWKATVIPRNNVSTVQLGIEQPLNGMCCLVMEDGVAMRVAPTFEPACSLNLEYLSIALQVRRQEGREPLFSLDPIERCSASAPEGAMQTKRFEPEWLAGTTVGEVMFQADYHLKELSMGEHSQPVVGMRSCFDHLNKDSDMSWSAREWFVVRKAEVHMSEDCVVVPYLKMGVEAREQMMGPSGMEDALLTRPNHPLVQYAEEFTHNFDLIAERKSVISQLREVAKASITAKFMLESGVQLEPQWFELGEPKDAACCLEVPQLWNDRSFAKICVDGEDESGMDLDRKSDSTKVHSVYGGVDFGIDRFRLAAPSRIATSVVAGRAALGRPASTLMATSQAGLAVGPARQFSRLAAPLSARTTLTAPSRLAAPLSARAGLAAPLSAMAAARPATSLMATSRLSMGAPSARLAAPLRASMAAPSRLAAPLTARAGLAAPLSAMAAARPATSLMATSRLSMGAPQARLAAPLSAMSAARPASSLMATSRISMAAPQVSTARLSMGMPRGVDLNLDKFNLSAAPAGSWEGSLRAPEGSEGLSISSKAFLANLSGDADAGFEECDKALFHKVFYPQLSDRANDDDAFVPPPTSQSYMQKLRCLVREEEQVREKRTQQFLGAAFAIDNMGPLFPSSWASTVEFQGGMPQGGSLIKLPLDGHADELAEAIASADPVFDRRAEDDTRFVVYRVGRLEVRATQFPGAAAPTVQAVFSMGASATA